ncbi:MAG: hypothetical protein WC459_04655 [Patescibacteria group bacterium]
MQKKYRRLIFYVFASLFILSVPFLLLYTNGYRYNFKKNKFEKTGALFVNTLTKDTALYLDGVLYSNKNEFRVPDLLPGEYDIKFVKSGFFEWHKKLSVTSQLTTFIKDLRLIGNGLPMNITSKSIGKIYPAEDNSKFIYSQRDNGKYSFIIFNSENDQEKNILISNEPATDIIWSPNNEKIIIKTQSGFKLANADGAAIALPQQLKATALRWNEKNDLLAKTADGIYKIDLLFGDVSRLLSLEKEVNDFAAFQNYIYTTDSSGIKQTDTNGKETIFIPFERAGYKIKKISDKKMFLLDEKGHLQVFSLPLVKTSTPELFANAKSFEISDNELLYYNDFEIWLYNFNSGTKELITRIGEEIKKAQLLPSADYVVFNSSNQIKVIEVDSRDYRQIFTFPKFEEIDEFILNKKYNLYFTGKMNKASGIYKLEL